MRKHFGGMVPRAPSDTHIEPARHKGVAPSARVVRRAQAQQVPAPEDIDIDIDIARAAQSKYEIVHGTAYVADIYNTPIYADMYVQWTQALNCFNEYLRAINPIAMPNYEGVVIIDHPNMTHGLLGELNPGGNLDQKFFDLVNSYLNFIVKINPQILFISIANGKKANIISIEDNFHNVKVMCTDLRYGSSCRVLHGFVETDDFVTQLIYKYYSLYTPRSIGIMTQDCYNWFGRNTGVRNAYVTIANSRVSYGTYDHAIWKKFSASLDGLQPMDTSADVDDIDLMDTGADDWMDTGGDIDRMDTTD
jgi:hypothetical protein